MVLRFLPLALAALLAAGCLAPDAVPGPGGSGGSGGSAGSGGAGGAPTGGAGGAPSLALAWVRTYGLATDDDQRAWSVAVTPRDDLLLAGEYTGSLTMGDLPTLPNTEMRDAFVARFDPSGTPLSLLGLDGPAEQRIRQVIAAPDDGVLVAGSFTQALVLDGTDLGDTPLGEDGFVASIAADQTLRWIVLLAGPGSQAVHALALSPDGDVFLAGHFDDTLALGDLTVEGDPDTPDFFVARLDPAGEPLWATSLGADPAALAPGLPSCHLAAAPDGGVHVAGTFQGTVRLDINLGAAGTADLFVARLDPAGVPVWGHALGAPGLAQRAASIAVDAAGRTLLAGDLTGAATLAGTLLASDGPAPDAFLALFAPDGTLEWARPYGSVADDGAGAAAFAPAGDILFTGRFRGALTFGPEPPLLHTQAVSSNDDLFLAVLRPDGAPVAAAAFGGLGHQIPTALAADSAGAILLAGHFTGTPDFGAGPHDAQLGDDLFLLKLTLKEP